MEKHKKNSNFLKKNFFKLFICLIIFFYPINVFSYEFVDIDNNLTKCELTTNCIYQIWKVDNSEKAFTELIQILENTPRLNIVKKDKDYIHAIAISRIMKFIDDIEIKIFNEDNIFQVKSSSRLGIYDLGVNKRRVETLHFRLIDIYS